MVPAERSQQRDTVPSRHGGYNGRFAGLQRSPLSPFGMSSLAEPANGQRFLGRGATLLALARARRRAAVLTLGLYRFWLMTDVRRFLWSHHRDRRRDAGISRHAVRVAARLSGRRAVLVPIYAGFFIAALESARRRMVGRTRLSRLGVPWAIRDLPREALSSHRTIYRGFAFRRTARPGALRLTRAAVVAADRRHAWASPIPFQSRASSATKCGTPFTALCPGASTAPAGSFSCAACRCGSWSSARLARDRRLRRRGRLERDRRRSRPGRRRRDGPRRGRKSRLRRRHRLCLADARRSPLQWPRCSFPCFSRWYCAGGCRACASGELSIRLQAAHPRRLWRLHALSLVRYRVHHRARPSPLPGVFALGSLADKLPDSLKSWALRSRSVLTSSPRSAIPRSIAPPSALAVAARHQ